MSWVADRARQQEVFRHDLDLDGSTDALAELLPQLVGAYPQEVYLAAHERERPARCRVITSGLFGPLTDVVCLTDFPPHIARDGDDVAVVTVGKEITFGSGAAAAADRWASES